MNAISLYQFSHWLHVRKVPVLPKTVQYLIFLLYNSFIPPSAVIGAGSLFAYGGMGVVLHVHTRIGRGCLIGQGVTIGAREAFVAKEANKAPVIGDNCYIAAGAKILGDIRIGNNCIIGANAVVLENIPDNSVVVGMPGKPIKTVPDGYRAIRI
ncbi:chloramphenicol acetyltransferase [Legionella geestiana]|uniref:Chloramphenicol acetyltransferase n=1 Tax=Legionella geestiana TaxID=45065 RepID=A0A0W0TZ23_9GAMM|nr:DapH/DapD/GlmU-related protein [Legionella geestiana]KTD00652.1 chloramphenicol acetyltransferase [Legionella geestiana]QBS11734.1 serine acetyltransferase [Legionella geestiana]QDQ40654.1 serine acetyltransferase [Legionella geestiana]STX53576.1 acetyltransferase [Legionella geestiana]